MNAEQKWERKKNAKTEAAEGKKDQLQEGGVGSNRISDSAKTQKTATITDMKGKGKVNQQPADLEGVTIDKVTEAPKLGDATSGKRVHFERRGL